MSSSTTIPVVATETATALVEGKRFASYDDFKIALEGWEITDSFTARMGKLEAECILSNGGVYNSYCCPGPTQLHRC
jgi:hypothetical protein